MSESPPPRRPGVRDVAVAARVSTQTVSRVLNGYPGVRGATRDRVLAALEELKYRGNNAARALGTRRSRTIGLLAPSSIPYGAAAAVPALSAAAREHGLWLTCAFADLESASAVRDAYDHLLAQGVDGIIIVTPHRDVEQTMMADDDAPPTVSFHGAEGARQRQAAALAIRHLVDQGHTRIAELAGHSTWIESVDRREGVREALASAGLSPAGIWTGDWTAEGGARVAEGVAQSLRAGKGPTAVAVANDQMALGLIAGLSRLGLAVPRDVSVIGFDDNPDAAYYLPGLTTVRLDLLGEARRAICEIVGLDAIVPQAPVLVRRESVASLR
jgi:DNA-binding LacI/PurR family transcriptional regulator